MRVSIRTVRSSEPELDRWVDSLPGTEPERRAFARLHLEIVYRWIVEHDGHPPGAIRVTGIAPPVYWWQFFPGWWMRIAIRDHRRWFRTVRRDIVVVIIQDEPPGESNVAM
jgi:hypothetical protein